MHYLPTWNLKQISIYMSFHKLRIHGLFYELIPDRIWKTICYDCIKKQLLWIFPFLSYCNHACWCNKHDYHNLIAYRNFNSIFLLHRMHFVTQSWIKYLLERYGDKKSSKHRWCLKLMWDRNHHRKSEITLEHPPPRRRLGGRNFRSSVHLVLSKDDAGYQLSKCRYSSLSSCKQNSKTSSETSIFNLNYICRQQNSIQI